jgi:exodeoxyribonuclease-5
VQFLGQQAKALDAVGRWLDDKSPNRKPVFKLMGYAGTGKTTLAKEIAEKLNWKVAFMAFTGKAAHVLRKKGCIGASTIHQSIYKLDETSEPGDLKFILNDYAFTDRKPKCIIVDEVSMVNEEIGSDLMSFGIPILVLGDTAQLPPVSGAGFFTNGQPDFLLTEIHRQAADSPIIRLATMVREQRMPGRGEYGTCRITSAVEDGDFLNANQVIVGKNDTRRQFNNRFRNLLGFAEQSVTPVPGEKLICLRNNHRLGFLNGGMWKVKESEERYSDGRETPLSSFVKLTPEDDPEREIGVRILNSYFSGAESEYAGPDDIHMDYGYTITAHKSQGSEWDYVIIIDESGVFRDSKWKWLYTAMTRASERLDLVVRR